MIRISEITRLGLAVAAVAVWTAGTGHGLTQTIAPAVRYLGQTPPGTTPSRFAPGIVSTSAIEINAAFRPDFREFFFARQVDGVFTLFRSTLTGSAWSAPEPLSIFPGGAPGVAVDMAYSPDGRELFFLGRFKPGVPPLESPLDIWVTRQRDGRWTSAETVPEPVSTDAVEIYPTVVADGSLYFVSDRPGGHGRTDIYRAQRGADGRFGTPVNIGSPPNSNDDEGDTFVSPDERYLIFGSSRRAGVGRGDLYVSFRAGDGGWGPAIHLGATINTPDHEFCPMVTPDGRYLFFSRTYGGGTWPTTTDADVFWVDMAVVERLKR
jgi:Tol biopolymer transport system component